MTVLVRHPRKTAVTAAALGLGLVITGMTLLSACGGSPPSQVPGASPAATTAAVTIYLHKGPANDPARVVAVKRAVPRGSDLPAAALTQLLAGPTVAEHNAGYWSWFSGRTAGMLRSAQISNGIARADFRDFSAVIPNASSSFGSAALLAELDATLKQFPGVSSTVYSFNGDVGAFYQWLQRVPPSAGKFAATWHYRQRARAPGGAGPDPPGQS